MRRIFFVLFIVACSSSGTSNLENKYNNSVTIPEKDMIEILRDYHLADGVNSIKNMHDIMSLSVGDTVKFLDSAIIRYGYDRARFDTTIKIYIKDLRYFSYIYDNVIKELSKLEGENSLHKNK